jgi:signal transduction histidine kinase
MKPQAEATVIGPPVIPTLKQRRQARSLTMRLTLVAAIGALPVLVLAGASLLWLFNERMENKFDAFLNAYQQQLIAGAELASDGSLRLSMVPADPRFGLPFSGWYWQVSAGGRTLGQSGSAGPLEDPRLPVLRLPPTIPSDSGFTVTGPGDVELRVVSREVRLPGATDGFQAVVAGPQLEIDQEVLAFGVQVGVALAALGIAFVLATVLQVRFGLQPLRALQETLQDIRKGAAQRLVGDYPVEVSPLVEELNEVLTHNEALIKRARVQAGNLAHGLKSPLTVLRHELAEMADGRGEVLREQVSVICDQVERVLARIRAAGPLSAAAGRTSIRTVLEDLAFSLDIIHRERGIGIEITCPEGVAFIGDPGDLAEMLGNLMDNGCKWARSRVQISVEPHQGLTITIEDDGPGIPEANRSAALSRGGRLDETKPGSGLGLDIVVEIAELYRGSLRLEESSLGGLLAQLELPSNSCSIAGR